MVEVHPISSQDIVKLRAVVRRRASGALSPEDVEDIAGDILLASTEASTRTGIPIVKLAFTNAKRGSFYAKYTRPLVERPISTFETDNSGVEVEPADTASSFEGLIALTDLIARLPFEERIAWLLLVTYQFTLREAAEMAGSSVATMQRRHQAALDHARAAAKGVE